MSIYDWGTIRTQKMTTTFETVNVDANTLAHIFGVNRNPKFRATLRLGTGEVIDGVITDGLEKSHAEYEFNFTPDDPQDLINKMDMANYEREMYEEGWGWQ